MFKELEIFVWGEVLQDKNDWHDPHQLRIFVVGELIFMEKLIQIDVHNDILFLLQRLSNDWLLIKIGCNHILTIYDEVFSLQISHPWYLLVVGENTFDHT